MPILLDTITFDDAHTSANEVWAEVGGRDERIVTLSGIVAGLSTATAIEARLDAILDAASREDYSAALSLRPGRRLWVRRNAFKRDLAPDALAAAFTLELAARDPFEEAIDAVSTPWSIHASGDTLALASAGTVDALPRIELTAGGTLVDPAISDGTRTIAYPGIVASGQTLVFDAATRTATIDGVDITPYCTGLFPRIAPEGTTLTYSGAPESTHAIAALVIHRARWW